MLKTKTPVCKAAICGQRKLRRHSNLIERQGQVFTQIVQIFHSDREPRKCIVDAQGGALFGWDRSMGHECRMFDKALHSPEAFCQRKKLRMLKGPSSTGKIRIEVNW